MRKGPPSFFFVSRSYPSVTPSSPHPSQKKEGKLEEPNLTKRMKRDWLINLQPSLLSVKCQGRKKGRVLRNSKERVKENSWIGERKCVVNGQFISWTLETAKRTDIEENIEHFILSKWMNWRVGGGRDSISNRKNMFFLLSRLEVNSFNEPSFLPPTPTWGRWVLCSNSHVQSTSEKCYVKEGGKKVPKSFSLFHSIQSHIILNGG